MLHITATVVEGIEPSTLLFPLLHILISVSPDNKSLPLKLKQDL